MLIGLITLQSTTHPPICGKKIRPARLLEHSSPSGTQRSLDLIEGHQPAGTKKEHAAGLTLAIKMALLALTKSATPMA